MRWKSCKLYTTRRDYLFSFNAENIEHVSLILTNHATLIATSREDVLEGKKMDWEKSVHLFTNLLLFSFS